MGVTIHHKLIQSKRNVKNTLDIAQEHALAIANNQAKMIAVPMEVRRLSDHELLIDIGECETLVFEFKKFDDLPEWERDPHYFPFNLERINKDHALIASGFCKTQFAKKLVEHRWVADLIKTVAKQCEFAYVNDEGGYYHTGKIDDATEAIVENGKLIDSLTDKLGGMGYDLVKGGSTEIKSRKSNTPIK